MATKITAVPLVFPIFYTCYRITGQSLIAFSRARREGLVTIAQAAKAPFIMYVVKGGTHFNIVRPVCTLLAEKLRADHGPDAADHQAGDEEQREGAAEAPGGDAQHRPSFLACSLSVFGVPMDDPAFLRRGRVRLLTHMRN